jgi:hypothetical protein
LKSFVSGFNYQGIVKLALIALMLSTILYLYGDDDGLLRECPLEIDFDVVWPNGDTFGSEAEFTYTISIKPDMATKYDSLRTYALSSEYFSTEKKWGSIIPVSSDVKNGETYRFSQFPITRHLTVKVVEGIVEFIYINVVGYRVEGCPDLYFQMGENYVQQESELIMTEGDFSSAQEE